MRERIAEGREQVVAQLAQAVAPLFQAGSGGPDPELTALMLSTMADEAVRLLLRDPERYPPDGSSPRRAGSSTG